jgi:hypothetical protein
VRIFGVIELIDSPLREFKIEPETPTTGREMAHFYPEYRHPITPPGKKVKEFFGGVLKLGHHQFFGKIIQPVEQREKIP